jgi:acyl-CoA synthetase (AMP-forming)/AMP-acid ligase II
MSDLADPRFLDDRLAHWAQTKPDGEALTYFDRTWTWAQWNDRVRRLAGALAERGVKRGDVVAFLDKNHPACVELNFAAASLGAANAIINFRLAADELDYVLNDSGAKLLIVGAELKPMVDKIRDKLPNVEHIVEVTPEGGMILKATSTRHCLPVGRPPAAPTTSSPTTRPSSCTRRAPPAAPRAWN